MNFPHMMVTDDQINLAKSLRAHRDDKYDNLFVELESDLRWAGDLGEICFKEWVRENSDLPGVWIMDEAAGNADFTIGASSIGLKTVKRKVKPTPEYTAQISSRHASEPVDYYFFCSYEFQKKIMWFLGGITRELFLKESTHYAAGEYVHKNYQIREGHEIDNIEIFELTPANQWVEELQ